MARGLRGAAAAGVRDRLPHARQRERGGGRGPGGPPPPPPRRAGGRADRVAARLPVDRGHAARDRPAALGPRAARDLRRRVAARAAAWRAPEDDPARQAEVADSLSLAFLVLLESLSPEQRAVFLLREVFDYPYDRIAEIVGKSEANVRQLAVRARRHVERAARRASTPRASSASSWPTASSPPRRRATSPALEALLAEDVELHGDGGGKAPALARRAVRARARGAHAAQLGARRRRGSAAWRCAGSTSTASPAR